MGSECLCWCAAHYHWLSCVPPNVVYQVDELHFFITLFNEEAAAIYPPSLYGCMVRPLSVSLSLFLSNSAKIKLPLKYFNQPDFFSLFCTTAANFLPRKVTTASVFIILNIYIDIDIAPWRLPTYNMIWHRTCIQIITCCLAGSNPVNSTRDQPLSVFSFDLSSDGINTLQTRA